MSSPREFRLATVLRIRRTAQRSAAVRMAEAHTRRERARLAEEASQARLVRYRGPLAGPSVQVVAALVGRRAMAEDLAAARVVSQTASEELAAARADWQQAEIRVRALQRLAERHAEWVALADARAEQAVLDEAAARVHRPEGVGPG
ncbi:MAG: flagellar export protein FliJ [Actinomycetes bacterium]